MKNTHVFERLINEPGRVKILHGAPYCDGEPGIIRSIRGSEFLIEVGGGVLIYVDQERVKVCDA